MNPLAQWDALKSAIDHAHSVIDLKAIRDQAEAYRYAIKLAGEAPEYLRKAEIIKVRAERRAGELLQVMPKQRPGEYKRSEGATVQTLEEQGRLFRWKKGWMMMNVGILAAGLTVLRGRWIPS